MAKKKKKQFNQAKFNKKSGVLSYNYLGGEAGKGRGAVSIVKQGDDWFFADSSGKVRKDVGINGKLTPTHMNNLRRDGIFAAAEIDEKGKKLSKAEIKDNKLSEPIERTSLSESGNVDITSEGNLSPDLAQRGNLRLRDANETFVSPSGPGADSTRAPINYDQTLERRGMSTADAPAINNQTPYVGEAMDLEGQNFAPSNYPDRSGMGIGENVYSAPAQIGTQQWERAGNMSLKTDPNNVPINNVTSPQSLTGQNEFTGFGQENMSGPGWGAPSTPTVQRELGPTTSEWAAKGFASEPKYHQEGSVVDYGQHTRGPVSQAATDRLEAAAAPGVTVEKDSPWGAADWSAVGSVMKGVGGLASAYTGIKNYQLARDAFNTQKNQWQQDYDQRVKAFEQNRKLANQDIQSRNRTLLARNKDRTDTYSELKA